jgi:hypothetical protein
MKLLGWRGELETDVFDLCQNGYGHTGGFLQSQAQKIKEFKKGPQVLKGPLNGLMRPFNFKGLMIEPFKGWRLGH